MSYFLFGRVLLYVEIADRAKERDMLSRFIGAASKESGIYVRWEDEIKNDIVLSVLRENPVAEARSAINFFVLESDLADTSDNILFPSGRYERDDLVRSIRSGVYKLQDLFTNFLVITGVEKLEVFFSFGYETDYPAFDIYIDRFYDWCVTQLEEDDVLSTFKVFVRRCEPRTEV